MSLLDRVQGAVLGAAIGDAMGHPTEFLDAEGIQRKFGRRGVEGFALYWEHAGQRFAPSTDDAQMAEVVRGWAAHEAIAAAAYILARHADDPREAVLEGANAPGDSDSIATLAGALVGARLGIKALPPEWVRDVERSAELLDLAREAAMVAGAA
jgi:ADP-ribosylglycohydrolase